MIAATFDPGEWNWHVFGWSMVGLVLVAVAAAVGVIGLVWWLLS